jgi:hypothetical protein
MRRIEVDHIVLRSKGNTNHIPASLRSADGCNREKLGKSSTKPLFQFT